MGEVRERKAFGIKIIAAMVSVAIILGVCPTNTFAEANKTTVVGKVYEFDKDSDCTVIAHYMWFTTRGVECTNLIKFWR